MVVSTTTSTTTSTGGVIVGRKMLLAPPPAAFDGTVELTVGDDERSASAGGAAVPSSSSSTGDAGRDCSSVEEVRPQTCSCCCASGVSSGKWLGRGEQQIAGSCGKNTHFCFFYLVRSRSSARSQSCLSLRGRRSTSRCRRHSPLAPPDCRSPSSLRATSPSGARPSKRGGILRRGAKTGRQRLCSCC